MPYKELEDRKKHHKNYYEKNKKELNKKSYEAYKKRLEKLSIKDREIFIQAQNEKKRAYYQKNKQKMNKQSREYNEKFGLLIRYGITNEDYWEIYKNQGNKCAICNYENVQEDTTNTLFPLFVDHCHDTKKVRGLLCRTCNLLLGHAYNNIENLKNAIKYLEKNG